MNAKTELLRAEYIRNAISCLVSKKHRWYEKDCLQIRQRARKMSEQELLQAVEWQRIRQG